MRVFIFECNDATQIECFGGKSTHCGAIAGTSRAPEGSKKEEGRFSVCQRANKAATWRQIIDDVVV
jgi:hypothetical protein